MEKICLELCPKFNFMLMHYSGDMLANICRLYIKANDRVYIDWRSLGKIAIEINQFVGHDKELGISCSMKDVIKE